MCEQHHALHLLLIAGAHEALHGITVPLDLRIDFAGEQVLSSAAQCLRFGCQGGFACAVRGTRGVGMVSPVEEDLRRVRRLASLEKTPGSLALCVACLEEELRRLEVQLAAVGLGIG